MSKEIGMLAVVVLKAKNLHDRHSFYKQDPYAKVSLNGKPSKTQVDVKGGQHPEWDAEFRFPVYATINDASRQMEVACWRAESKDDEEIGKGKVDISDTLRTGEFDDWVTIKDDAGTYRGEIYLEMTFFASGPPPLERRPSKLPPQERLQHLKKKQSAPPAAGGSLTIPGGAPVYQPPRNDKPLQSPGHTPLPPTLRPGAGPGKVNGQGRHSSEYIPPINSLPPSSLFAGRPPTSPVPVQQPNNPNPPRMPGHHSRTSSGSGYGLSHSPPHLGHSPPRPSYSPPLQNPYVSGPAPQSDPGSGYFPAPQIVVGNTPSAPVPYNTFTGGSSYSPPRQSPPQHSPPHPPSSSISTGPPSFPSMSPHPPSSSISSGPPSFPSTSPQQHSPGFYQPQQTSSPYPPPQSDYFPSQSGYPPPQSTYPPPSQPGYPGQAPPQFPSHYPSFHAQPQDTYSSYGHTSPAPGPGQRPFFGGGDSNGEFPDPGLTQRYSSPLPLPDGGGPWRSSSPFPVPSVPPAQHPVANPYSPSAEYERELQSRREQEERDAELARRLDMELNLRG